MDLPGYFASVSRFADAVVALDDGSTDETWQIMHRHPLVEILLTNPRRDGYAGWNDSENRNRLLTAAGALDPGWIMSLDADERIDPEDGVLLREFVEAHAQPGKAYRFRVFRMIGGLDFYDHGDLWVGRLFPYERDHVFPRQRLHIEPIPTSIPRSRWLKTSIRIQHLAGTTEERRRARFQKYLAADPGREFQPDYGHLLQPPTLLKAWEPRPPALPVAFNTAWPREAAEAGGSNPALSVVVISRNDEHRIARTLRSVVSQDCPESFEVIVVTSGSDRTAEIVRTEFPEVRLIELERPALPGEARNAGLRAARGRYVSFPGSHVELPAGSFAARLRAHGMGFAMVTGSALNGTRTWAGWAAYFLDHSTALPGRPAGVLAEPPAHCSYLRDALLHVGGFPEALRAGEDTVVNTTLFKIGYGAYRAHDIRFIHHTPCRTPWRLLWHHLQKGRAHGTILVRSARRERKWFLDRGMLRFLLVGAWRLLRRMTHKVHRWGHGFRHRYWMAFPLIVVAVLAQRLGGCYELMLHWWRWRGARPVTSPSAVYERQSEGR